MINYLILFLCLCSSLATLISNVFILVPFFYKNRRVSLALGLGLTFIIMLLISVLDLIPEGISFLKRDFNYFMIFCIGLFFLMIGYVIFLLFYKNEKSNDVLYRVGVLSAISLFLHNIPEGIICSLSSLYNFSFGFKMCVAMLIHNIPEGLAICLPIFYSSGSRKKAFIYTLISSMGEFLGALVAMLFLRFFITDLLLAFLLLVTAGIMIAVSLKEIFGEGFYNQDRKYFIWGCLLGLVIVIVLFISF